MLSGIPSHEVKKVLKMTNMVDLVSTGLKIYEGLLIKPEKNMVYLLNYH